MSNNKTTATTTAQLPTLEAAKYDFLGCIDIMVQAGYSFNTYHDPHKKELKITTVNSADGMRVLIPGCDLKFDRHDRAYAEFVIEYA